MTSEGEHKSQLPVQVDMEDARRERFNPSCEASKCNEDASETRSSSLSLQYSSSSFEGEQDSDVHCEAAQRSTLLNLMVV